MQKMWEFKSGRFTIRAEIQQATDLDFSFDETGETAENLNSGLWEAFDTKVSVCLNGVEIGNDWLSGSIYANPTEFFSDHRDPDPMKRNCSIGKELRGGCTVGHYFPDMVAAAIQEARTWIREAGLMKG